MEATAANVFEPKSNAYKIYNDGIFVDKYQKQWGATSGGKSMLPNNFFLSTCNVIRSKVIETFSNLNKGLISRKPQNFIKYK